MVDVVSFSVADTTAANNVSNQGVSILGTGLVSTADDTMRAIWSIVAKFYDDFGGQSTVAGTGDAITITSTTVYTALASGMRLMFKASAANTTAATLNLDAIGAKAVRKISGGTDVALTANDIPSAGARVDMVYDSTANSAAGAWILISGSGGLTAATNVQAATATSTTVALTPANLAQERGYSNDPFINLSLVASVGSSALTIAVKGQDGNDPSATNPVYVSFRSATLTSGLNAQLAITSALSLVISSGSTLGMTSAVAATLAIGIVNDAGTARLAIQNPTSLPLVDGIVSTTAEGGAGAADSAGVLYTGTAATSKAITYVGFAIVTETTAGTWATAPSTVQVGIAPAVNNAFPSATPTLISGTVSTGTASVTIDFSAYTQFSAFRLILTNARPVNNGVTLIYKMVNAGGVITQHDTFTSWGDYVNSGGQTSGGATSVQLAAGNSGLSNSSTKASSGTIDILNPFDAVYQAQVVTAFVGGAVNTISTNTGRAQSTSAGISMTKIQILFDSGNIADMKYRLQGIR